MAVYDTTVKGIGKDILAGLEAIASAIRDSKSPTYNVIINTAATDPDEIAQAAQEALERTQAREAAIGK